MAFKSAKQLLLSDLWKPQYDTVALNKYYGDWVTKIHPKYFEGKTPGQKQHALTLELLMKRDMPAIMDKIAWLNRSPMSIHHWKWHGTDKLFERWPQWFPDRMTLANYNKAISELQDRVQKKIASMLATATYKMKRAYWNMLSKGAVKARTRTRVKAALSKLSHFRKSFRGLIPSTKTPRGQAAMALIKKHLAPKLADKLVVVRRRIKHRKMTEKWAKIREERRAATAARTAEILERLRGWGELPPLGNRGFADDYPVTSPMKISSNLSLPTPVAVTPLIATVDTPMVYPESPPFSPTPIAPEPKRRALKDTPGWTDITHVYGGSHRLRQPGESLSAYTMRLVNMEDSPPSLRPLVGGQATAKRQTLRRLFTETPLATAHLKSD